MTEPLSWLAILFILGAGQGAFLSLSLLTNKVGSYRANRYLAALTLLFTVTLFDYFLDITGLSQKYIQLTTLLWPKEFFFGVLIYFYVRELTRPDPKAPLPDKQWLHFIPGIIHVVVTWSLFFTSTGFQQTMFADEPPEASIFVVLLWLFFAGIETILSMLQILIYLSLSFRLLYQHSQRIKQTFSSIDRINLHWLTTLLAGVLCIYLLWIVGSFLSESDEDFFSTLMGCCMVAIIYTMGYFGLRQPQIFSPKMVENVAESSINNEDKSGAEVATPEKYKNSPLDHALSTAIVSEIKHYMATEKPYLDSQISLPQLADKLDLSVHYLSQTINEQLQQNFFDFINSYRIEEAKRRLASAEYKKHSILTIAMDSGFNSKSSFYNAFKKHMEMTPTQYRKSLIVAE